MGKNGHNIQDSGGASYFIYVFKLIWVNRVPFLHTFGRAVLTISQSIEKNGEESGFEVRLPQNSQQIAKN